MPREPGFGRFGLSSRRQSTRSCGLEAAKQDRSMASLVRVVIGDYLSKRKPERRA